MFQEEERARHTREEVEHRTGYQRVCGALREERRQLLDETYKRSDGGMRNFRGCFADRSRQKCLCPLAVDGDFSESH